MKKWIQTAAALSLLASAMGCAGGSTSQSKGADTLTGSYTMEITGYDWGAGTSRVTITLDHPLDSVDENSFTVTETKGATDFTQAPEFPIVEGSVERKVTAAYLVDENGKKTDQPSTTVELELYVSPDDGSPITFTLPAQLNIWCNPYSLEIVPAEGASLTSNGTAVTSLTIDSTPAGRTTSADAFQTASYTAEDGVSYEYAYYTPETDSDTLVVWLHGLGEGGTENTDPYITLLANKVTALAGESFQSIMGGAHVLVPQCPSYWMDNDGKGSNFNDGGIQADGTSYYTESLHELIESYKAECGASKVILAGCSNDGYMTMLMAMNYPEDYDAIVPICEAVPDAVISDEQISAIKDLPIFFIYSEDDTTVDPTLHEIPTIARLMEAGAENVHVSTSEHVIDTSGTYTDENGNPYQYMGHWSWIYFDNNESLCDECDTDVWNWMAEQVK